MGIGVISALELLDLIRCQCKLTKVQLRNGNFSFQCGLHNFSVNVEVYCAKSVYSSSFTLSAKCKTNTVFKLIGRFFPLVKIKVSKCTEKPIALDLLTLI